MNGLAVTVCLALRLGAGSGDSKRDIPFAGVEVVIDVPVKHFRDGGNAKESHL